MLVVLGVSLVATLLCNTQMKSYLLLILLFLQIKLHSQEIQFNKTNLDLFPYDSLIIENIGKEELIINSIRPITLPTGYDVRLLQNDTTNFLFISRLDENKILIEPSEQVKLNFDDVDLCIICKESKIDSEFKDTLLFVSNSINKDTSYIYVNGNGVISTEKMEYNIPNNYLLEQNYPNPFNPSTTINFTLKKEGYIKLLLHNSLGEKIKTLESSYKQRGNYQYIFNAPELASGSYFYSLIVNGKILTKKMLLLK